MMGHYKRGNFHIMNIDILITRKSESGLVTDTSLPFKPSHVILDYESAHITLHGPHEKQLLLNIPLSSEIQEHLVKNQGLHIGYVHEGMIEEIIYVPLVIITPFDLETERMIPKPRISALAFEIFMRECAMGQAVHRAEISNEHASGGILNDVNPAILKFAPTLMQQRKMEMAHAPTLGYAPTMNLGLGAGASSSYVGKPAAYQAQNGSQDELQKITLKPGTGEKVNPMSFFTNTAITERLKKEREEEHKKAQTILDKDTKKILEPIQKLIGMVPLKERIESVANLALAKALRTLNDLPNTPLSLHMIFTGGPGTGKTTAAREIGRILYELGYLANGHLVETSPRDIRAKGIKEVIEEVLGGILFIDEAYGFFENDWDDTVPEIPTLLKMMEEHRDELVVIMAGYKTEMRKLISSNAGLESRFSIIIDFPSYTADELTKIFESLCLTHGYYADAAALQKLYRHLSTFRDEAAMQAFGNGRGVRNIFESSLLAQSSRIMTEKGPSPDDMKRITEADILKENDRFQEISADELKDILTPLNQMTGLDNIKHDITDLVTLLQAHIMRKKMNLPLPPIVLHSIFEGPPGTGKTTVARLLGKIYKRLGYLEKGHVVEVDKSKLVGRYIGWTTQIVNDIFHEAEGGILFIDEAYALADSENSGYGTEALTTILKLMEDNRDKVVVICAGYEKEMKAFLQSNSGLESRFPRRLKFKTFTATELGGMFAILCRENQYIPAPEALSLLNSYFKTLSDDEINTAGNGRLVRNIFEKTIIKQSRRIVNDAITGEAILHITQEDISLPEKTDSKRIGFV